MDASITGTISRTIITHGCTQMMVLSILFFGGAEPALLRARAHHRHLLRHLLVGAGGLPARHVPRRLARGLREAGEEDRRARGALSSRGVARRAPGPRPAPRRPPAARWSRDYGVWVYAILFAIIFAETGFVVTPVPAGRLAPLRGGRARRARAGSTCTSSCVLARRRRDPRQHRQLRDRPLARPALLHRPRLALAESRAPRPHARLLRAPRRQGGGDLALPADRAHLRALRGRAWRAMRRARFTVYNVAGARALGRPRSSTRATSSATSPGCSGNLTAIIVGIIVVSLCRSRAPTVQEPHDAGGPAA